MALNCVANGRIFERTDFREVYVQPAAHDAGTSIGAALHVQHQILNQPRSFVMRHVYYGPKYTEPEIQIGVQAAGCQFHKLTEAALIDRTVETDCRGENSVGWFQGRMEFGPRALGKRSILADPPPSGHEGYSEQPHQIPRTLPSVLPVGPGRVRG